MKALVLLFIAGVAGLIAYLAFVGECSGGTVVRTEAQCRNAGGLTDDLCREVFSRAQAVARSSSNVYSDVNDCAVQFGQCLPHATLTGAVVPAPAGFCVITSGGSISAMTPVYQRAAVRN